MSRYQQYRPYPHSGDFNSTYAKHTYSDLTVEKTLLNGLKFNHIRKNSGYDQLTRETVLFYEYSLRTD
jgi:hypothetical protein